MLKSNKLKKEIVTTIKYFHFFKYSPSFDQIYTFLPTKVSKILLTKVLNQMVKKNKLLTSNFKLLTHYALPPHGIYIENTKAKYFQSIKKEQKIRLYLKILSNIPQISLVGYSGSMALYNASKKDDIDLFIISKNKRLWTARFMTVLIALLLGIKRKKYQKNAPDKVCLNLFFDDRKLLLPNNKRNYYTAHEVLQMRPIINRDNTYNRFLNANQWVYNLFPNAKYKAKGKRNKVKVLPFILYILNLIGDCVEFLLKNFQLILINRNRTTEIITDTQLWFFPDDFQKKLTNLDI